MLAAAYAEAARFKEAVETAQKAKQAAAAIGDRNQPDGINGRIELYKAAKPYRDALFAP